MKAKAKPGDEAVQNAAALPGPVKLSVNVTHDIGSRLRKVAFEERLSESSIVEIALDLLFAKSTDAQVGKFLRDRGASLRRSTRELVR